MSVITPFFVGIAGPSGSGKSTLARAIEEQYPTIARVRFDNYFKEPEACAQLDGEPFWETPESLDLDMLYKNIRELKEGQQTHAPLDYDRVALTRSWGPIEPAPVMLTEGFLLFADERIRELFDIRIYMDLPEDLQLVRRMERTPRPEYVRNRVINSYRPHAIVARECAHHVIDASLPQAELLERVVLILRDTKDLL